jgi:hypothetical protein
MSANVIQHTKPRRKRVSAWSWTTRHFMLLAIVVIGIVAASWLAQVMTPPHPAPATAPQLLAAPTPTAAPTPQATIDIGADLTGPPPLVRARPTERHTGIPLEANSAPLPDSYEVLSADELDAISQARN